MLGIQIQVMADASCIVCDAASSAPGSKRSSALAGVNTSLLAFHIPPDLPVIGSRSCMSPLVHDTDRVKSKPRKIPRRDRPCNPRGGKSTSPTREGSMPPLPYSGLHVKDAYDWSYHQWHPSPPRSLNTTTNRGASRHCQRRRYAARPSDVEMKPLPSRKRPYGVPVRVQHPIRVTSSLH